jgi:hypothetical protein
MHGRADLSVTAGLQPQHTSTHRTRAGVRTFVPAASNLGVTSLASLTSNATRIDIHARSGRRHRLPCLLAVGDRETREHIRQPSDYAYALNGRSYEMDYVLAENYNNYDVLIDFPRPLGAVLRFCVCGTGYASEVKQQLAFFARWVCALSQAFVARTWSKRSASSIGQFGSQT